MFCPICNAEYRLGFTRCADCDVELVNGPQQPTRNEAPPPEKYGSLLWRGDDPHLYLFIVSSVGRELACYGRPQHPVSQSSAYNNFNRESAAGPFEVWVSEADLPRAKWIVDSAKEKWEQDPPGQSDIGNRGTENGEDADPIGVCPLCSAEFDSASSLCANCNVPLHVGRPRLVQQRSWLGCCNIGNSNLGPDFGVSKKQST